MSDCPEKETLVAWFYEECDAAERARVERHLKTCAACAAELDGFAGLRSALREWAPPDARLGFRVVAERDGQAAAGGAFSAGWLGTWRPAWGLALAAASVVLAAAALASVEVRYGGDGFVFRIGRGAPEAAEPPGAAGAGGPAAAGDAEAPPWRAELAALERQLRGEFAARREDGGPAARTPAETAAAAPAGDDLLRQVRALMDESEHRQRQEFASGLIRLAQEVDLHRQADQLRVQQEMDSLADYMVRVAQR